MKPVSLRSSTAFLALLAAQPAYGQDVEPPARDIVLQELATTYRVLADEQFLGEDREGARANYEKAAEIASRIATQGDKEAELLVKEITYRRLLLERGNSFWGARLSAQPINPVRAFVDLEAVQKAHSAQIKLIDDIAANIPPVPAEYQIGQALDEENVQVGELVKLAALTRVRDVSRRRTILETRLAAITEEQQRIEAQRGPLLSSMNRVNDALNAALIQGVAQYAGVPAIDPQTLSDAARGEVTGLLTNAALAYASGAAPAELASSLGEFSETAQSALELYQEVRGTVGQIEAGVRIVNAARDGNAAALVQVGSYLYGQLSPEAREAVGAQLGGVQTIDSVLAFAQSGTELRRQISDFLVAASDLGPTANSAIAAFVDPDAPDFEDNFAAIVRRLFDPGRSVMEQRAGLEQLGRGWAISFVSEAIGDDQVIAVAAALGGDCRTVSLCRDWLQTKARSGALASHTAVEIDRSGLLTITGDDGTVLVESDMAAIADRVRGRPLEAVVAAVLKGEFESALASPVGTLLRGAVIDALPGDRFDADFGALLRTDVGAGTRALAVATADAGDGSAGAGSLERTLAGAMLARELAGRTIAQSPANNSGGGPTSGDQMAELAVRQSLAAMGPYGIAASIALTAFQSMGELDDLADQLGKLDGEDRKLTEERMHLTTLAQKLDTDEALALIEEDIATLRVDSAGRRMERYRETLRGIGEDNDARRRRIRDSLPLTYYYSERLRQNLALLDQSLGFWAGQTGISRNVIDAVIRTDPNNARLALDPQIRLFDWLGGSTAQRADLFKLDEQWKRTLALATTACGDLNCRPDLAVMGSVRPSGEIALSSLTKKLAPRPCEPGSARRCVEFLLEPGDVTDLASPDGLRLVTIGARLVHPGAPAGAFPTNFEISHSGLGFIREGSLVRREQLEPSRPFAPGVIARSAANLTATLNQYQGRWRTARDLGEVEGYPLFGLYRVALPASFNPATSELWLTFLYQVPNTVLDTRREGPAAELLCKSPTGALHLFSPAELPLLVGVDPSNRLVDVTGSNDFAGCTLQEAAR